MSGTKPEYVSLAVVDAVFVRVSAGVTVAEALRDFVVEAVPLWDAVGVATRDNVSVAVRVGAGLTDSDADADDVVVGDIDKDRLAVGDVDADDDHVRDKVADSEPDTVAERL